MLKRPIIYDVKLNQSMRLINSIKKYIDYCVKQRNITSDININLSPVLFDEFKQDVARLLGLRNIVFIGIEQYSTIETVYGLKVRVVRSDRTTPLFDTFLQIRSN